MGISSKNDLTIGDRSSVEGPSIVTKTPVVPQSSPKKCYNSFVETVSTHAIVRCN